MSRLMGRGWTAAGLSLVLVLLAPATAHAVYQCGDQTDDCQCGANDPYPCCDNGGNCTWWAWEAACCNWAVPLPGWGNANQWVGNANLDPDYEVLGAPVAGSVACRVSGTYGHVAWVTSVSGATITVTEENCCDTCNYGMRTRTYDASYFDGGYIVRKGQCECSAGQTQSEGCGSCGQRERTCGTDCQWGDWQSCAGEGACVVGQSEEQDCGDCGKHSRTCDDSCQWGDFGACSGPDPNDACDTGLQGGCAAGTRKCVDGTLQCESIGSPADEVCDGTDNDCDGETDENGICGDGGVPTKDSGAAGASGSDGGGADSSTSDGGTRPRSAEQSGLESDATCACNVAGGGGGGARGLVVALMALLAVGRRRRRDRTSSRRGGLGGRYG